MASSSKKRTTMAKHNRENSVRERRARKQAKKDARKQAAAGPPSGSSEILATGANSTDSGSRPRSAPVSKPNDSIDLTAV